MIIVHLFAIAVLSFLAVCGVVGEVAGVSTWDVAIGWIKLSFAAVGAVGMTVFFRLRLGGSVTRWRCRRAERRAARRVARRIPRAVAREVSR